jgi:hypothetical protein
MAIALIAIVTMAYSIETEVVRICLAAALVIVILIYLTLSFKFAFAHPSISVLEGAEATRYMQAQMAIKDITLDALPVDKKQNSPPPDKLMSDGVVDDDA